MLSASSILLSSYTQSIKLALIYLYFLVPLSHVAIGCNLTPKKAFKRCANVIRVVNFPLSLSYFIHFLYTKFLPSANLLQQSNRTMDLPYPSLKDDQLAAHLSPFDRRRSLIIKDSLNHIPLPPPLPSRLRNKIINLIEEDLPFELKQSLDQEVVSFRAQLGREGSFQNILHVVCRQNAGKCLEYICRTYYQHFPQDYQFWVNTPNKQGMTPIMLCALNHSNECMGQLLGMGAVDIHLIDANKLSAYQIALNCKNEQALKILMQFENKNKREKQTNHNLLSQELELKRGRIGWCESFYKCLLDCITCGGPKEVKDGSSSPRKQHKKLSLLGSGIDGLFIDQVQIGFTNEELGFEVQWKLMGEYQEKGNYGVLFQNFSPYDMQDINCPLNNFLIVFQSLSQHPWLARRLIQSQKSKPGSYSVTIFLKNIAKAITTDAHLPFIAKTAHPLFLADKKQGWPMILQKALAKMYGSYKRLKAIPTKQLMESITGWPVITLPIAGRGDIYSLLKRFFFAEKYMYILEGKPNSLLSKPDGSVSCFTVLNFYQKGDKKLVLVNCPFVDAAWMEKERHEILALKILRGHFNCRDQMTIWVQEQRLTEYFSQILVAPIKSGYQRQSVSISTTEDSFFFKLQSTSNDENIAIYLIDIQSGGLVALTNVQGWRNDKQRVILQDYEFRKEGIFQFQSKQGEYLFKVDVTKGKYMIVAWAPQQVKLELLQENFGLLEWTACYRKNLYQNWKKNMTSSVEQTAGCSIVLLKSNSLNRYVSASFDGELLQGKRNSSKNIEMESEGQFGYIVVRGKIKGQPTFYQS